MLRTPVTLFGLAGVTLLAGSFAPVSFSAASLMQPQGVLNQRLLGRMAFSGKGDRMAGPIPANAKATVSVVELVGLDRATIILRDRNGEILYRSDPQSGITTLSKNTDLPVITLKEVQEGAPQRPAVQGEGEEVLEEQKPKHRNPIGCTGDVSPLAKASAGRLPKLCLALLKQSFFLRPSA